jgi:hypothetical protein
MSLKKCFLTLNTTIEIEPKNNDTYYKPSYKSDIQSIKVMEQGLKRQRKIKLFILNKPV